MTHYIASLQAEAAAAFGELLNGVDSLLLTDFPDHPNVGDSAIALGQFRFFEAVGISVPEVRCIGTFSRSVFDATTTVAINGGGNIAGAFDGIDAHRNELATRLRSDRLLIQLPQSVHFFTERGRERFVQRFASRENLRFAVRDEESFKLVESLIPGVRLAPDAVHHLGSLGVPEPTQDVAWLIRRDQESAGRGEEIPLGFDWPKDPARLSLATSARWKARRLGPFGAPLNPSPASWRRIASGRLERGLHLLTAGETVVTDRLHGMLLALQAGRRVIAIDNNNRKLSKYADTWFKAAQPDVQFVRGVSEARAYLRSRPISGRAHLRSPESS